MCCDAMPVCAWESVKRVSLRPLSCARVNVQWILPLMRYCAHACLVVHGREMWRQCLSGVNAYAYTCSAF